jgi:hypothetical protein
VSFNGTDLRKNDLSPNSIFSLDKEWMQFCDYGFYLLHSLAKEKAVNTVSGFLDVFDTGRIIINGIEHSILLR